MRSLETINPEGMRPSRFVSFASMVSATVILICLPLAWGATGDTSFFDNLVVRLLLMMLTICILLSIFSVAFRWDWRASYFGVPMICIASVSLIALVPFLSILIFGNLTIWVNVLLIFGYAVSHIWWCRKFVTIYKDIFNHLESRGILYEEDADAVYYKRDGDNLLLAQYNFSQMPPSRYFLIFIILGFALIPSIGVVKNISGMPFAHVFLAVSMLPVSWMSIGLAVRGFLICYYYPAQIKALTGKTVYVDLTSKKRKQKSRQGPKNPH